MDILIINFCSIRGGYLIKYVVIGVVVCIICIIILALLKVASDFDDEVEKLYDDLYVEDVFYKNSGFEEEYDYYSESDIEKNK